jgi:PIN domain nuclease of toxin-antitoxin system
VGPLKLLLDTCTLIWLAADPTKLSDPVAALIDAPSTQLILSDCSVWELCLKWEAGKIRLPQPPRTWIADQQRDWHLEPLPMERTHLFRVSELPGHHRDPFDRLLVAQAIEAGLTIATPDPNIRQYPVATVW